jgi:hypothetical protein
MLKKFIKPTLVFVLILFFIGLYGFLFGKSNVVVGISTTLAILMYLSRDLTANPVKTLTKLMIFNVIMGLLAYGAAVNLYLGIPINFISLFLIAGTLSYTLSSPISTPFSMQYIFLIATPISLAELPLRLAALAVGAVFLMAFQLLVNRNRLSRQSRKLFCETLSGLALKIRALQNHENSEAIDAEITATLHQLKQIIYDARVDQYFFTAESEAALNLVLSLEQLGENLSGIDNPDDQGTLLADLEPLVITLTAALKHDPDQTRGAKTTATAAFNDFQTRWQDQTADLVTLKMLSQLALLKESLAAWEQQNDRASDNGRKKQTADTKGEARQFKAIRQVKIKLSLDALSLSYAFRLGLAVSLCAFLVGYFSLPHGNWLLLTISSLTYPFYELSRQKTGLRILGTIIGGVVVVLIFSVLHLQSVGILIMIISLYLTVVFMSQYLYMMIFTTITSISALVLMQSAATLSLDRIFYVILGGVLVLVLSRVVLPYTRSDARNDLQSLYDGMIVSFFKELEGSLLDTADFKYKMMNYVLITTLIEDSLKKDTRPAGDEDPKAPASGDFLAIRQGLLSRLYQLYRWLIKTPDTLGDFFTINRKLLNTRGELDQTADPALFTSLSNQHPDFNKMAILADIEIIRTLKKLGLIETGERKALN